MINRDLTIRALETLDQFPAVGLIGSRQSGKTTLAKVLGERYERDCVYLDLELPSDLAKLTEPEIYLDGHRESLVILDEIHRTPELFPILRGLIDRDRRPGRFLILGSATPELLRQGSETLAGRIIFLELTPFTLCEVARSAKEAPQSLRRLWIRGGYPESYLARSLAASRDWREAFVSTFLERDVPQLGFRVSATRMRRFWEMLAHIHGQVWNASNFARNFDVSAPTVRHHLDLLTDTFLVRQLQPLHANIKKRLVKSPKVYIRDSGLLHSLLRVADFEALQGHPGLGASFEGLVLEQILHAVPPGTDAAFYRAHSGDEIDLVLTFGPAHRIAVEIKHTASPKYSARFRRAMDEVGAGRGYIVMMGREAFPLDSDIRAVPLRQFLVETLPTEAGQ